MSASRNALVTKGIFLAVFILLIFSLSRFGPHPFPVLAPPSQQMDNLEHIHRKREVLRQFLMSFGHYSSGVFILLQAIQVIASPIPGELTGVVGGYVYGKTYGLLLSTVGLTLGSWVAFELARILGKPFLEKFVKKNVIEKFDFLTTNAGATTCFLLFLIPGFPKDYLSYILGLSRMQLSSFLIVSTIGRIPGTYFLTIQGASIRSEKYSTAVVFAVISVLIVFVAYLYRNYIFARIKRNDYLGWERKG